MTLRMVIVVARRLLGLRIAPDALSSLILSLSMILTLPCALACVLPALLNGWIRSPGREELLFVPYAERVEYSGKRKRERPRKGGAHFVRLYRVRYLVSRDGDKTR